MPFLSSFINFTRQSPPEPPPKGKAYVNCIKPTSQIRTSNSSKKSNSVVRRKIVPSQTYPISQPTSQLISQPIFQIEKSITHVFVAAKQLLETLKKWSQQKASNAQVSDVYVCLGNEFNLACRVFTAINIDTSDIGKFPALLHTILKTTLSQEASVESLETYLPQIRDTIIKLLRGLKSKQQKLRHNHLRNVKGNKSISEKLSTGSGIITSLGSFTVDNSPIKDNLQRERESVCRASTPTNHVVIYHNICTPSRRAQTTRDQVPSVTTIEENFPTLSLSRHMAPKNAFAAVPRSGILNTQDSRRYSTDQICNDQGALLNICQNTTLKSNQTENLSPLENKKQILSSPPQSSEDLTIFLQYKTNIKKFSFSGSCSDLSIAKLQQAFIEKFAWNTHHNGVDLPDIYIQDPKSGIRHELEDLNDIKDRSVLVLNVEVLDEVKRHIDDGLGSIIKMIENIKTVVVDQQATIQRVLDRQQDTAEEVSQLEMAISSMSRECNHRTAQKAVIPESSRENTMAYEEVQALRRDVAIFRQNYSSYESDIKKSLNAARKISENFKTTVSNTYLPGITGEHGRKYVDDRKKNVNDECDKIVAHVDDLQDTVEDLRKDVALRGVQPHPRQLEAISKDIDLAGVNLKKIKEAIKREKLIWTETWKLELERVCNDQEDVNKIEDLIQDLEDDVTKTLQTFALVEATTIERSKHPEAPKISGRTISRGFNQISIGNPAVAKERLLDEVRTILPNHEDRLEAIERAEKLRARGFKSRHVSEFEIELEKFVEEGKLRKSGGYEEIERVRQKKDERIRWNTWDNMNGTTLPDAVPNIGIVDTENIDKTNNKE